MHTRRLGAALAALLTLGATAASAATLTRKPYLQQVTTGSALVAFGLDTACATAQVKYGPEGGALNALAKSADTGTRHAIPLSGLEPARRYSYVVEACGATTTARTFSTASQPGSETLHFAALGDMGTGGSDQADVAQAMLAVRPELWVTMGDNAYDSGTESEFQNRFFAPMAALIAEVPTFASPGNHEYSTPNAMPYVNNFFLPTNNPARTERYYSFDWGPVHFVSLDSQCGLGYTSTPDCSPAAQTRWLEEDLATTSQQWKVAFFHHAPWSSGDHGSYTALRTTWGPLLEKYGVDLVLVGHDHNYERSKPMVGSGVAGAGQRGVTYVVVGSGGASLRPFNSTAPSWSAYRNATDYGFLDVKVDKGTLRAEQRTPAGKVVDTFTLTKTWVPATGTLSVALGAERGKAPFTTTLTATTNLPGATVTWDLGDGTVGTGASVSHTWTTSGTFQVLATARGSDGRSVSQTQAVVVDNGAVVIPDGGVDPGASTGTGGTNQNPQVGATDPAQEQGGGCAAAPGLALPALLVGAHALLRRRRRRPAR